VQDKKAEWIWGVLAELEKAGLITLADKGYHGSTWAKDPLPREEQAGTAEKANRAMRHSAHPTSARTRSSNLADPPRAPLLPLARRSACQGNPRIAAP
jgi:hypothetical protein